MSEEDIIQVQGLSVCARIGVTREERAYYQHLLLDLQIVPQYLFHSNQKNSPLVDYSLLTRRLRSLCAASQWQLIETLATEVSSTLLLEFSIKKLTLRIRKFVLPHAEFVAVQITRER